MIFRSKLFELQSLVKRVSIIYGGVWWKSTGMSPSLHSPHSLVSQNVKRFSSGWWCRLNEDNINKMNCSLFFASHYSCTPFCSVMDWNELKLYREHIVHWFTVAARLGHSYATNFVGRSQSVFSKGAKLSGIRDIFFNFSTPPHYLGLKKLTVKYVNSLFVGRRGSKPGHKKRTALLRNENW